MAQKNSPNLNKILMDAPIYAKLLAYHFLSKMASRENNPLCLFPKIKEYAQALGVKFSAIKKMQPDVEPFYAYEIDAIDAAKKDLDSILSTNNTSYEQFKKNAIATQNAGSLIFTTYYETVANQHIQQAIEKSGRHIASSTPDIAYLYIFKTFSNFSHLFSISLDLVLNYKHEYDDFVADLFYYLTKTSVLYWFNSMIKMTDRGKKSDEIQIILLSYLGYSNYFLQLADSSETVTKMFVPADPKIIEQARNLYDCIFRLGQNNKTFKELTEEIAVILVDEKHSNSVETGLDLLFKTKL